MRQLAGPSNTFSGGRLVRVEEEGGLMRTRSNLTSSDLLRGGPTGNWVDQKGETCVRGRGRTPHS